MSIVAIPDPIFQPAMRIINSITNGYPALVMTSFAHNYVSGTIVRFYIPWDFGMTQINHQYSPIMVVDATSFTIDIDTTDYDAFIIPPVPIGMLPPGAQSAYAQVVPIGEINSQFTASRKNILSQ